MTSLGNFHYSWSQIWGVLSLFLIPIGGGIPAGVLLAKANGILWPFTTLLYFISDLILACIFEPILIFFIRLGKRSAKAKRFGELMSQSIKMTLASYGNHTGAIALILFAFGADPMTGRSAAVAAGHGFVMGWMFAIIGDMLYFGVLMASTLWLNGLLGDGTLTTIIILAGMIIIPGLIRKFWNQKKS